MRAWPSAVSQNHAGTQRDGSTDAAQRIPATVEQERSSCAQPHPSLSSQLALASSRLPVEQADRSTPLRAAGRDPSHTIVAALALSAVAPARACASRVDSAGVHRSPKEGRDTLLLAHAQ